MKTKKALTRMVLVFINIFVIEHSAISQQHSAKYFAGINAGIGWETTSIFSGESLECILVSKKNKELGIKVTYTNRYRFGNLILFSTGIDPTSTSEIKLDATGYLYTNRQAKNTGFFLAGEAGMVVAKWKVDNSRINYFRSGGGLGFGWKWILNDRFVLLFKNSLLYTSPSGVVSVSSLSFGF